MTPGHAEDYIKDLPRRIGDVEKFVSTQGTTIARVVETQADFLRRLEKLEMLAQMRAVTEAREDERDKALYSRLDRMEDQMEKLEQSFQTQIKSVTVQVEGIKGVGSKALWVFISAFVVAIAAFIIKGGLA